MNTINRMCIGSQQRNVGIDVGKNQLDICIYEKDEYWQTGNKKKILKSLSKRKTERARDTVIVVNHGMQILKWAFPLRGVFHFSPVAKAGRCSPMIGNAQI